MGLTCCEESKGLDEDNKGLRNYIYRFDVNLQQTLVEFPIFHVQVTNLSSPSSPTILF